MRERVNALEKKEEKMESRGRKTDGVSNRQTDRRRNSHANKKSRVGAGAHSPFLAQTAVIKRKRA